MGEQAAELFLVKQGFTILDTNYCCKYGEIDIVAEDVPHETIHFIEVKSATYELNVSHETKGIRPEENMTSKKLQKLYRTIEIYLSDKKIPKTKKWQLDLYVVFLDQVNKQAKIRRLENIV